MSEVLADAKDINRAINDTAATLPSEQEEQVEAELNALVREEEVSEKLEKMKLQEVEDAAREEESKIEEAAQREKEAQDVDARRKEEERRVLEVEQTLSAMSVPTSATKQDPVGRGAVLESIS